VSIFYNTKVSKHLFVRTKKGTNKRKLYSLVLRLPITISWWECERETYVGVAVVGLRYFCHIYGKYDKNKENVEKIQLGFFLHIHRVC